MKTITTESSKHKSNIKHAISESLTKKGAKKFWQFIENRMNKRFPNK